MTKLSFLKSALFLGMGFLFLTLLKTENTWGADQKSKFLEIFKKQECTKCHSLKAYNMAPAPTEKGKGDGWGDEEDDIEAPDLSKLSDKVMKADLKPDEYIRKFLKKQLKRDGKKHKHMFKGTDAEFKILIDHLLALTKKSSKP
ncbi:MAG: hypothetical protein HY390_07375 [Deltaproteobacteria bacterium]|nr:hypothetical protein [Deltaproteobacteria bacterium]